MSNIHKVDQERGNLHLGLIREDGFLAWKKQIIGVQRVGEHKSVKGALKEGIDSEIHKDIVEKVEPMPFSL